MNNVTLMGRLTRDPEVRYTDKTCVTKFTLAVKRPWTREGEALTDFIPCVAFNKTAELIGNGVAKGDRILITLGCLCINSYKDKQDKLQHYTEVRVNSFDFVEPKTVSGQVVDYKEVVF